MSGDEIVTYAEAARWLPTDVRERIETTVPCISGGEHDWQHRSIDVRRMESAFTTTIESWSCTVPGCNLTVKTDPTDAQRRAPLLGQQRRDA